MYSRIAGIQSINSIKLIRKGKQMKDEDIRTQLAELIAEYANAGRDKVAEFISDPSAANLVEDLGYDSVSLIALIAELEERFNLNLDDDVLFDSFDTYDGILMYLTGKAGVEK